VPDPLALLNMAIPCFILFGVSIMTITLVHLGLSISGNQFRTEISAVLGLVVFIGTQFLLGIYETSWTLFMVLLVTPLMVYEAVRPLNENDKAPVLLDTFAECNDVLCFSHGGRYVALGAMKIISLPREKQRLATKDDIDDELKVLHPLWENSKQSGATFTIEVRVVDGLVELVVFVLLKGKDWKSTIERVKQSREHVETWLNQMDYSYEILGGASLEETYKALNTDSVGVLRAEGIPKRLSGNLGLLVQRLVEQGVSASVQVSFSSGAIPRFSKESGIQHGNPEKQPRIPHRVEDHNLRSMYKQMVEIEACEETGVFRCGMNIIVHGGNTLHQVESIIKSVWSSVKVKVSPIGKVSRSWNRYLLRDQTQGTASMSGARLYALIDLSEPLPGLTRRVIPPEFLLPLLKSEDEEDSVLLGDVLFKTKKLQQKYRIPKDKFCLHTGIYGNTGSGKTNTVKHIISEIHRLDVPFLVIDPATNELRQLGEVVDNLRIFTVGNEGVAPFRFNPFEVPPSVPIQKHIDNLTTCFTANWPTEGILVELISKVFRRAYSLAGWDTLKDRRGRTILLSDLQNAKEVVINELEYGPRLTQEFIGALKTRFESIIDEPQIAVILNTEKGISIPELLSHPTVIELRSLSSTMASLVSSLILVGVAEYLEARGKTSDPELKHVLVLEEAHRILKQVDTGGLLESHAIQQQATNTIVNLLREARGYGLGIMFLDQLPGGLADAAVKTPGITIIHLFKVPLERVIVGGQANLTDAQMRYIGSMKRGEAIVHEGFMEQAVNIQVPLFPHTKTWSDFDVSTWMDSFYKQYPHMLRQHLPRITQWKPDPMILFELKQVVEEVDFLRTYDRLLNHSVRSAENYVQGFVERVVTNGSVSNVENYTSYLIDYLHKALGLEGDVSERG